MNHPHVIISPITNNCVNINVPEENKYVSKLLLKISSKGIHNNMVRSVSQGVLSEARDKNKNIMINDYVL